MDTSDDSELICRECDETFQLEDGCEQVDYCHGCVYAVLDKLIAERDEAVRTRDLAKSVAEKALGDMRAELASEERKHGLQEDILRAELTTLRAELANVKAHYEALKVQAPCTACAQLTELREAAEAMRLLGPECKCGDCEWCVFDAVIEKLGKS